MLRVLNRIIASARIQNKTPTLQDAKLILKDLLNNMQSVINIEDIQKIVVAFTPIYERFFVCKAFQAYCTTKTNSNVFIKKIDY